MDTSNQYVNMCSKAKEIQAQWKHSLRTSGDWYFHDKLNKAYAVSMQDQNDRDCIWLPRQDQLQEMMNFKHLVDCWNSFYWFCKDVHTIYCTEEGCYHNLVGNSMEQLWLAFVMKEKHGKIWKGEKWISGQFKF